MEVQTITGADIYAEFNQAQTVPFEELSEKEQFIFNLFAETVEEVLEEQSASA